MNYRKEGNTWIWVSADGSYPVPKESFVHAMLELGEAVDNLNHAVAHQWNAEIGNVADITNKFLKRIGR